MMIAAMKNRAEIAELLIENGANINDNNEVNKKVSWEKVYSKLIHFHF